MPNPYDFAARQIAERHTPPPSEETPPPITIQDIIKELVDSIRKIIGKIATLKPTPQIRALINLINKLMPELANIVKTQKELPPSAPISETTNRGRRGATPLHTRTNLYEGEIMEEERRRR